ncbi:MAG: glycosyltransferase family 1 protein [Bacteroidota bacterium]
MKVIFFHRKPEKFGSFSLEYIFKDVRARLSPKIEAVIAESKYTSRGLYPRLYNTIEAAFRQKGAVNHMTGDTHYVAILLNKRKTILTVLDCGFMHQDRSSLSKKVYQWFWLKLPVARSRFVTAISKATKDDVVKFTNCDPDKVSIVPVAISPLYQPKPQAFRKAKPRLLHIGTNPNKNLPRLIEAIEGISCHLAIVGKLSEEYIAKLKQHRIEYSNVFNISDEEMVQQYEQCDILSFVSTYEGFGMPIVEANAVERPVITGNLTSMPDVAGDAACLVDPFDVQAIREGIQRIIEDDDYREQLIRAGRKNKLRFDPDVIAEQYYELYKRI